MTRSNNQHTNEQSMGDVSHTNPYTGETAGRLFNRGSTIVADGGRPRSSDQASDGHRSSDRQPAATDPVDRSGNRTMEDVSHTPPDGAEDANEVFERGHEHGRERGDADV
ncbi:hypothetical protein [Natronococcus wangiae]|uniref:hypothetical protein n=1 Tax=Natronococcus wangiae TaxID=3068275 RepID=UPI00273D2AE0|nr:hypothetical protein [Natronococcus sp. AD5]